MQLLVIRHAIAEDKEDFARTGRSDDLRPLTSSGRAKMRRVAGGLREVAPTPSLIATSPLLRARQTAEIVSTVLGVARIEVVEALRPEQENDATLHWLTERADVENMDTLAIVGHEPHLGGLVTWLMTGFGQSRVELKKGGACLLGFDGPPTAGEAILRWLMGPGQLRRLGG